VNLLADPQPFTSHPIPFDPHSPGAELVPFPEYPNSGDKSSELATHAIEWLTDEAKYRAKVAQLSELKTRFAHSGASRVAAEYILSALRGPGITARAA
jgi:hypothetical protein